MAADTTGLKRKLVQRQRSVVQRMTEDLRGQLRAAAPRDTGQLTRSIKASWSQVSATRFLMVFETGDLVQANTTNTGARPHLIRPRRQGGMLRFRVRSGGVVFTRLVHHPGNRATHWWDKQLTPAKIRNARRRAIASASRI